MFTRTSIKAHSERRRWGVITTIVVAGLIGLTACGEGPEADTASGDAVQTTPATAVPTAPPRTVPPTAPPTTAAAPSSSTPPATTTPPVVTSEPARVQRPTEPVDGKFGPEGSRVHVQCAGQGDTTVVLIAGFEAGSDSWVTIQPQLSQVARVCSYDRPGTGTSDPPASNQTFLSQAEELHELLAKLGEPGPYVLVGHSFGGAEAATFASRFVDDVAAVVLVDASPVAWPAAICAVSDDGSAAAATVRGLCQSWSDPMGNVEHLDVFTAFDQASTIGSLGSLPMTVITAVDRSMPDGLAPDELARLTAAWDAGQVGWQQLSANARLVSVPNTSHQIQVDHPELVFDEIVRLLPDHH